MQIKPHQIKHFAEQQRRFKLIIQRLHHVVTYGYSTDRGSYFSRRFRKLKLTVELSIDTTKFISKLRKFEGECFYNVLNGTDKFNKIDEFLNVNGFNSED